ncbi:Phosphotransferase enzyme [Onygenales sp. PD_40]|nr:Phosphotransferase enzyme [Onygenales sp. PD_40]KAK2761434.1 Phosphotransferase enzyme [Emmonsiellopsis sp. PD_33]KAK2785640.1 Phosphotransferase enzyme [Onygenales sp. PD_12]KAK2799149.1 Phosphotransferase enzyme [Onygenales sp. PD_10]
MWASGKTGLFAYTSGRFLFNEHARLRERYVEFDVDAFKRLAANHIDSGCHGKVLDCTKLAEGGFNRVFLLDLEDGFQAIAKIPYPIAVPKHYATASEAATLQFLHSRGVPAPKVYGYASTDENPAGTEYIIMEKARGVGLETRWLNMTKRERHKLASSFVDIERKFFDIPFNSTGSIYFKSDVPAHLQAPLYGMDKGEGDDTDEELCIGPIADYMFWMGKRAGLDIYRGPWSNPKEYLESIAQREIQNTRKHGKPLELDFPHNTVFPGKHDPEEYIKLLEKYLAICPYLLPKELSAPLSQPTLRHPDLNPNNIFVDPDSGAISCIIDWQHTIIEPRLLASGYPRAFENPDSEIPAELKEPLLPRNHESLSSEEKIQADELYRRQLIFYYYRIFNGHLNKAHLEAMRDPLLLPRQHLVDRAGREWTGNLMTLKGALVRMVQYWNYLPDTQGVSCPISFSDAEIQDFHEQEQTWFSLNTLVNQWREEELGGVGEDGWVSHERYDEAVRKLAELKGRLIETADGDVEDLELLQRGWPFREVGEE